MSTETWGEGRELGWVRASGDPHAVGAAIGAAGRAAVHRHLVPTDLWSTLTGPDHAATVARLGDATRARFPAIWAEIAGLAEGLNLPLAHVMAWNCRGDLLASAPDGCTTILLPGSRPRIGHNEDGLPFFRGACFIAEVAPAKAAGAGFRCFCYPGSLPGHTFAIGDSGLALAVNNLRLLGAVPEIPRMVLGRAVLAAGGLDAALALLQDAPSSGGFHFTLAQAGRSRLVSVEFGGGRTAIRDVEGPEAHANHALHLCTGSAGQLVTDSSRDRQVRGDAHLAAGTRDALAILRDGDKAIRLPIHRSDPDDPDNENTLATALMEIGRETVLWRVHDSRSETPVYRTAVETA